MIKEIISKVECFKNVNIEDANKVIEALGGRRTFVEHDDICTIFNYMVALMAQKVLGDEEESISEQLASRYAANIIKQVDESRNE